MTKEKAIEIAKELVVLLINEKTMVRTNTKTIEKMAKIILKGTGKKDE